VRQMWIIGLAVSLGMLQVHVSFAVVSGSAQEHAERGYALLAQARLETESASREHLLTGAVAAFKAAYQSEPIDPTMQVHALLGAAQAELLVQHPRRVFPFLWQATPLQRAEKNLQQALVLQPDNAAATFLLGLVYWRQAAQAPGQQDDLERSKAYLIQAAALGIPVHPASTPERQDSPVTLFGVEDTVVALRYVDAQGVGRMNDLLFVYRSAARETLFGVIVTERQAYPLATDSATGTLAPQGLLDAITTTPQPGKPPILVLRLQQGAQSIDARFTWDGVRFVSLPALP
jgi:tetratricopeptide (TPR) repeat protein